MPGQLNIKTSVNIFHHVNELEEKINSHNLKRSQKCMWWNSISDYNKYSQSQEYKKVPINRFLMLYTQNNSIKWNSRKDKPLVHSL